MKPAVVSGRTRALMKYTTIEVGISSHIGVCSSTSIYLRLLAPVKAY